MLMENKEKKVQVRISSFRVYVDEYEIANLLIALPTDKMISAILAAFNDRGCRTFSLNEKKMWERLGKFVRNRNKILDKYNSECGVRKAK